MPPSFRPADSAPTPPPTTAVSPFRLPNGMVGRPYRACVEVLDDSAAATIHNIAGLAESGLAFDAATGTVAGTPQTAGEWQLAVIGEPPSGHTLTLVILPDPESLWKDLPSDRSLPRWKPDTATYASRLPDRWLLAASVRGRSHAHRGDCRDDDMAFVDEVDGWSVLAVADGAGSAALSRYGARVAARTAANTAADQLCTLSGQAVLDALDTSDENAIRQALEPILGHAARCAAEAVGAAAAADGVDVAALATTLILAVYRPTPAGAFVAAIWVGDGAAAALSVGTQLLPLGAADSGEFAGQTRFLDAQLLADPAQAMARIRFGVVPQMTALLLMTDGVSDPCFESDRALGEREAWERGLWDRLAPVLNDGPPDEARQRLARWLPFPARGHNDDRTLAVLLPRHEDGNHA